MTSNSTPHRYEVRLRSSDGTNQLDVLTWYGPEKALEIALGYWRKHHPEAEDPATELIDLGSAVPAPNGTMIRRKDLTDRREW